MWPRGVHRRRRVRRKKIAFPECRASDVPRWITSNSGGARKKPRWEPPQLSRVLKFDSQENPYTILECVDCNPKTSGSLLLIRRSCRHALQCIRIMFNTRSQSKSGFRSPALAKSIIFLAMASLM
jgi:hypothetical protein